MADHDVVRGGGDVRVQGDDQDGAPRSWASTNGGALTGAMPAKVSENIRPTVTAGFANEVEEVNQ